MIESYLNELSVLIGVPAFSMMILKYIWPYSFRQKSTSTEAANMKGKYMVGKWEVLKGIAKGGYGYVVEAKHRAHKRHVAIKRIPRTEKNSEKVKNEADIHASLKHKNIIEFIGEEQDKLNYYLIMYFAHENLYHILRQRGDPLKQDEAREMIRQIVNGLEYIHAKDIMHGDIKLDNILIGYPHTIKICDLGCAKKVTDADGKKIIFSGKIAQTRAYSAPEKYSCRPHEGLPTDVWSLGIVVIRLGHGSTNLWNRPKKRRDSVYAMWLKNKDIFYQESHIIKNVDIVKMCLSCRPEKRKTMTQIKHCLKKSRRNDILKWLIKPKPIS